MAETLSSQHTNTFPQLLNQAGASVVVSTYQAGKLILLRSSGDSLNTHFVNLKKPMGVAYSDNRLSVGSGVQVIDYFNMPMAAPKVPPLDTHDQAFLPRRLHYTGDIDIHEMGFSAENELWIVNTKMSCLGTLDLQYSFVPKWRPPFITGYDLTDRCHLNGLAMRDGQPKYVSSLGVSDEPAGWRNNKAFGGMIMDIDTNEFITQGLSMPHSPRWYRDKLWVLESGAGQLITIDPSSGDKTVVAEVPGFCRGIDFIERYALIGLSQVRETAVFAGLPLTEREQDRKCGVWIVDIESGQTAGYLVFAEGVQEIFSVQVVPGRYPALLDLGDPLLATSYSLPDEVVSNFATPNESVVALEKAVALHRTGDIDNAIKQYQEILKNEPERGQVMHHLGMALSEKKQFDRALVMLSKAMDHGANRTEINNFIGQIHAEQGEHESAIEAFNASLVSDQKFASAHVNRGLCHLTMGNFEQGWKDYEWRWKMPSHRLLDCPQPLWNGGDIKDKTLLVYCDRGLGDSLQFARYLRLARQQCTKLIVACPEELRLLFKDFSYLDEVRANSQPLAKDSFDVYCPLLSLPATLDTKGDLQLNELPLIQAPSQVAVSPVSVANEADKVKLKVGLVWTGLATNPINVKRSCPLDELLKLTNAVDANYYSLQRPISADELTQLEQREVVNLEDELVSMSHSAAIIDQLDVVISVCTSVAHLSASMGKPTIVLLAHAADWRWGLHPTQSQWYPSATLIRQPTPEDWNSVIDSAASLLAKRQR